MNFLKANLLSFMALAVMTSLSFVLFNDLPDRIPTDFNLAGEATDSQPKQFMVTLLPVIYLNVIFLINILIGISPHKFSMPNSKRAMDIIVFGVGVLLCFLHFALLMHGGDIQYFTRYFTYGMALFLIIVGNVYGKTERNFFIGLNLPWTLASEANWRATHRLSGRLMVLMGLTLLVSNSVVVSLWLTVILCTVPLIVPVVYSPIYYHSYEKQQTEA